MSTIAQQATLDDLYRTEGKAELIGGRIVPLTQVVSMKKQLALLVVVLLAVTTIGAAYYLSLPNTNQAVNQDNNAVTPVVAALQLPAGIEAIELTPHVAKSALLDLILSSKAGPLGRLDADKVSAALIKVDQGGRIAEWGPFNLLIDKRIYYVAIRDPTRKDGHIQDFKGEFERVNGRWFATEPRNAP